MPKRYCTHFIDPKLLIFTHDITIHIYIQIRLTVTGELGQHGQVAQRCVVMNVAHNCGRGLYLAKLRMVGMSVLVHPQSNRLANQTKVTLAVTFLLNPMLQSGA